MERATSGIVREKERQMCSEEGEGERGREGVRRERGGWKNFLPPSPPCMLVCARMGAKEIGSRWRGDLEVICVNKNFHHARKKEGEKNFSPLALV